MTSANGYGYGGSLRSLLDATKVPAGVAFTTSVPEWNCWWHQVRRRHLTMQKLYAHYFKNHDCHCASLNSTYSYLRNLGRGAIFFQKWLIWPPAANLPELLQFVTFHSIEKIPSYSSQKSAVFCLFRFSKYPLIYVSKIGALSPSKSQFLISNESHKF